MENKIIFCKENRLCYEETPELRRDFKSTKEIENIENYNDILKRLVDGGKIPTQKERLKEIARRKGLDPENNPSVIKRPDILNEYAEKTPFLEYIIRAKNESKERKKERLKLQELLNKLSEPERKLVIGILKELSVINTIKEKNGEEKPGIIDRGRLSAAQTNIERNKSKLSRQTQDKLKEILDVFSKTEVKNIDKLGDEIDGLDIMARSFELLEINIKAFQFNIKSLVESKNEFKKLYGDNAELIKFESKLKRLTTIELPIKYKKYKESISRIINAPEKLKQEKDPLEEARKELWQMLEQATNESMETERRLFNIWHENMLKSIDVKDWDSFKKSISSFRKSCEKFTEKSGIHFTKLASLKDILITTAGMRSIKSEIVRKEISPLHEIKVEAVKNLDDTLKTLEEIKNMGPGFVDDFFQIFGRFMDMLTRSSAGLKAAKDVLTFKRSPIGAVKEIADLMEQDGIKKIKEDLRKTCENFDNNEKFGKEKIKRMQEIAKELSLIKDISTYEYAGKKGEEAIKALSDEFNNLNIVLVDELNNLMTQIFTVIERILEKKYPINILKEILDWLINLMWSHPILSLGTALGGSILVYEGGKLVIKKTVKYGPRLAGRAVQKTFSAGKNYLSQHPPKITTVGKTISRAGGVYAGAKIGKAVEEKRLNLIYPYENSVLNRALEKYYKEKGKMDFLPLKKTLEKVFKREELTPFVKEIVMEDKNSSRLLEGKLKLQLGKIVSEHKGSKQDVVAKIQTYLDQNPNLKKEIASSRPQGNFSTKTIGEAAKNGVRLEVFNDDLRDIFDKEGNLAFRDPSAWQYNLLRRWLGLKLEKN